MKLPNRLSAAAILTMLSLACTAYADEVSPIPIVKEGFRYAVTPYVWFPGFSGKLDYKNNQVVQTNLNSGQVVGQTDIALFLDGEVHYGNWGVMGNALYSKSSSLGSKTVLPNYGGVTIDSNTSTWQSIYTVAGTYTALSNSSVYADVLAGVRFFNMNSKVQLNASQSAGYDVAKTLYSDLSVTDAIAGLKGRVRIGDSRFFVPFYLDAGGGSATAKFTSQQMLGIGYTYGWGDITLAYTNLYYSISKNNVSSYINMTGPALAATFRF